MISSNFPSGNSKQMITFEKIPKTKNQYTVYDKIVPYVFANNDIFYYSGSIKEVYMGEEFILYEDKIYSKDRGLFKPQTYSFVPDIVPNTDMTTLQEKFYIQSMPFNIKYEAQHNSEENHTVLTRTSESDYDENIQNLSLFEIDLTNLLNEIVGGQIPTQDDQGTTPQEYTILKSYHNAYYIMYYIRLGMVRQFGYDEQGTIATDTVGKDIAVIFSIQG